ncbi:MAG: hypothetical protein GX349_02975 [Firmicutes bacterium]|nr:hypothetical protein [Bacillota bacterium]
MTRLLLIYSLIILISRVFKGFQESKRTAPRRGEPAPPSPVGEGLDDYHHGEKEREAAPVPSFPAADSLKDWQRTVTPRMGESVRVTGGPATRKKELAKVEGDKKVPQGLFSQPQAYVQGIIMAEVLQAPRSKRPYRPPI